MRRGRRNRNAMVLILVASLQVNLAHREQRKAGANSAHTTQFYDNSTQFINQNQLGFDTKSTTNNPANQIGFK